MLVHVVLNFLLRSVFCVGSGVGGGMGWLHGSILQYTSYREPFHVHIRRTLNSNFLFPFPIPNTQQDYSKNFRRRS